MVCMTMSRTYVVNVTASNQQKKVIFIPVSLQITP